jgi:hypothetical protein
MFLAAQAGDSLSDQWPAIALAAVVLTILGCVGVYVLIKSRRRRQEIEALAVQLGFRYDRNDPYNLPERYAHMAFFSMGQDRKATNVLTGKVNGQDVILFDYRFKTGSRKSENQTTYHFQAAILGLPIVAPRLTLWRASFINTMASWVGRDDLNFESAEFSRRTCVQCAERKFAYDVFHARLIEYLLGCRDLPNMELNGPVLVLSTPRGRADQLTGLITIGQEIIRSLPDYVLKDRGTMAAAGGKA